MPGGVILDTVLEGNIIVDWQGDPMHPMRGAAQGFTSHNPAAQDCRIEGNEMWLSAFNAVKWVGVSNSVFRRNRAFYCDGPSVINATLKTATGALIKAKPGQHPMMLITGTGNKVEDNEAGTIKVNGQSVLGQGANRATDYARDLRPVITTVF